MFPPFNQEQETLFKAQSELFKQLQAEVSEILDQKILEAKAKKDQLSHSHTEPTKVIQTLPERPIIADERNHLSAGNDEVCPFVFKR
jgi:hypothetical protein